MTRIVTGTARDDILTGSPEVDLLNGLAGDDLLAGLGGADALDGDEGNDTADYSASASRINVNLDSGTGLGGDAHGDRLTDIENLIGTDHALPDFLTGDDGANRLEGLAGDDRLAGSDGDDLLVGGAGADFLDGGVGMDTADYSTSISRINVNLASGIGIGSDAHGDRLSNVENLVGTDHSLADYLTGDASANRIAGLSGGDVLDGGADVDTADYSASTSRVSVNLLTGLGFGGHAAEDRLSGFENLIGSAFGDFLYGNTDDNTLAGGAGGDLLYGNAGIDTADYASSTAGVIVDLASGSGFGGDAELDRLVYIENVIGSAHADRLTGSDLANRLEGGAGHDLLLGAASEDELIGGDGSDTLSGGDGDDTLDGGFGADSFDGGAGTDTVSYVFAGGALDIDLTRGDARTFGSTVTGEPIANIENARGGAGDDRITGTAGGNHLVGLGGDDVLAGLSGADILEGGDGSDIADYSASNWRVNVSLVLGMAWGGHAQKDRLMGIEGVVGGAFDDTLTGSEADDWLAGGAGQDSLTGAQGDDGLEGGSGHDVLIGAGGNDVLAGGDGDDIMSGGLGADRFDGGTVTDTVSFSFATGALDIDLARGDARPAGSVAAGEAITGVENVIGGSGRDRLAGDGSENRLSGLAGADILIGYGGADWLEGGAGQDTADYSGSASRVNVNLATGFGAGGDAHGDRFFQIENLIGTKSTAADFLTGNADDNSLEGLVGPDVIDGGAGLDTADYGSSPQAVSVDLETGTGAGGHAAGDRLSAIERIAGSQFADTLAGSGRDEIFHGGAGADEIHGHGGEDWLDYSASPVGVRVSLETGAGSHGDATGDRVSGIENLLGSILADHLRGDDGNNILAGGAGSDTLDGGAGRDTVDYSRSDEGVLIDLGSGVASGGNAVGDLLIGIENIVGSAFADSLTGSPSDNVFFGTAGKDRIQGGEGFDVVDYKFLEEGVTAYAHGTGKDSLSGIEKVSGTDFDDVLLGDGLSRLEGRSGADELRSGVADYSGSPSGITIYKPVYWSSYGYGSGGDAEGDTLLSVWSITGSDHNDNIEGFYAPSGTLRGGSGDDTLVSLAGDWGTGETLVGGPGDDLLVGSLRDDTFVFEPRDGMDVVRSGGAASRYPDQLLFVGFGPDWDWRDHVVQQGADAVIHISDVQTITFPGGIPDDLL